MKAQPISPTSEPLSESGSQASLSFQHLQAELRRIDLLIRRQVLCWQKAGQDPRDAFRGLYIADSEAAALSEHPLGAHWGQYGSLSPEEEAWFDRAIAKACQEASVLIEQAHAQGVVPRLERLAASFGWEAFDRDAFLICAAPFLDLKYERLYGYLQDDVTRKRPSVNLILDLLCPAGTERFERLAHFSADAPLFKGRFLEKVQDPAGKPPLLSQSLQVDESVVSWLLGKYQPRLEIEPFLCLSDPGMDALELEPLLDAQTQAALEQLAHPAPLVIFVGVDRLSQEAAARLLANQRRLPLLSLDLQAAAEHDRLSLDELFHLALRDAQLLAAGLFIQGWDAWNVEHSVEDGNGAVRSLREACALQGMVVLAGRTAWNAGGFGRERSLVWFEFPLPEYPQRLRLWQHYLAKAPVQQELGLDLPSLAGQFQLTSAQIRDAVASARDRCLQAGISLGDAELFEAARAFSNPRLASLARKIAPRYAWEDIILPADQLLLLHEIVDTVRRRPRVLDEWGVGQKLASSRGVTVLFAGAPGTGKTMAAEVMAAELGLDLYKIDLSTVISKYIGETEKNLERIFNEAEASNAILFFDEADALFGKRSEVRDSHDRYANVEISYLLQRMEAYNGITILATNLRSNLDEAFTRRLQFAVDFPFPEEADRLRIWKTLFPPDVPRESDIDLPLLARRFKLAGGNIRNILVTAAYLAASDGGAVNMAHLLHGTRRELQKMGRLVGEEDVRFGLSSAKESQHDEGNILSR
jgi:hypothetical protein